MAIAEVLRAQGLSDEEIATLTGNARFAGVLESFRQKAESGETAYQKAQEIEANLRKFNDENVIPYVRKADERVAAAEARLAQQETYLKTMKAQGYEVPDAYLTAPATAAAATAAVVTPPSGASRDEMLTFARANMELISMSERARDLLGHGLDVAKEYEEFEKGVDRRPGETLRAHLDRKYDLTGKQQAKDAAAAKAREDALRDEGRAAAKAEFAEKYGNNPETILPRAIAAPKKFEHIVTDESRKNSWQTEAGRKDATKARLEKYRAVLVQ